LNGSARSLRSENKRVIDANACRRVEVLVAVCGISYWGVV
jgi:hypothetical protein